MIAQCEWKHDEVFETRTEAGNAITLDGNSAHLHGPSPMEAVLMALCACTSVDVLSILRKKRQNVTGMRINANATQADASPRVFTKIRLTYAVSGHSLSRKAVEDAVSLSKNKYCSVSKMLDRSAGIDYEIVFPDGEPQP